MTWAQPVASQMEASPQIPDCLLYTVLLDMSEMPITTSEQVNVGVVTEEA